MSCEICIDNRRIGTSYAPYLIAEMSANHNGSFETALTLIQEAKKAGVDAVKLQTYTPDTITLNCNYPEFKIDEGLWSGKTLYELYQWAHTPWDWHKSLFDYARKIGITIFSSPFDNSAVDLLEDLNAPAYKIASFEAVDLSLIRYVASTGKPMIISTGMANCDEISEAINAAHNGGCRELAVLHCVSGYPAPASDYNLRTVRDLVSRFNLVTGLSDHTLDNVTAITSIGLGASIVEKHFTLDRYGGGPDDSFSLEPAELAELARSLKVAWSAIGKVDYDRKTSEKSNLKFRRSLYFVKDLAIGDIISNDCVRSIRPGYGLLPRYLETIMGKKVSRDVKAGTPVMWNLIK